MSKLYNFINTVKELEEEPKEEEVVEKKTPEEVFRKVLISTIVAWAEEAQIETSKLVQEMFRYLYYFKMHRFRFDYNPKQVHN